MKRALFFLFVTGAFSQFAGGASANSQEIPVVFVHGILAKPIVWWKMEQRFKSDGYKTIQYGYPSTKQSIRSHGKDFAEWVQNNLGNKPFYLVSHSMGNLVAREAFHLDSSMNIVRWVMLAPPNQGAEVADILNRLQLYRWITGTAGQDLLASEPQHYMTIPPPSVPFAIIAGGKGDGKGYNPLLSGDNDGEVRVSETYLAGAQAHIIIRQQHTAMLWFDETYQLVRAFLERGSFSQ
jgi:hypothetical protein